MLPCYIPKYFLINYQSINDIGGGSRCKWGLSYNEDDECYYIIGYYCYYNCCWDWLSFEEKVDWFDYWVVCGGVEMETPVKSK